MYHLVPKGWVAKDAKLCGRHLILNFFIKFPWLLLGFILLGPLLFLSLLPPANEVCEGYVFTVTGGQPWNLHTPFWSMLWVWLILIGLDGQSLGSRHTEIYFNKIYFPRKQPKIHYHFLTICLWLDFKIKLQKWNLLYWQQPKAKAKFNNLNTI